MRRPSAMRLSHATAGLTRALPAMPIKTRAAGDGHVYLGSSRAATSASSSATTPRPPVRQAGNRDESARTGERVSGRRTTSWTESFCIVAVGDKLQIGFVGNARPRCTLEDARLETTNPSTRASRQFSGPLTRSQGPWVVAPEAIVVRIPGSAVADPSGAHPTSVRSSTPDVPAATIDRHVESRLKR